MIEAVNSGAAATEDIREALAVSKAIGAKFQAFQGAAAAMVAARERHGDGGAAVLAQSAGVSRRQAGAQARTNEMLKSMPVARGAVESGEMSFENARRLADAAAKTGAGAVDADEGLLAQAVTLGEDDFAKSARRWALRQQTDGGEADYARRRARRYVRFWDADGMVHLKGEFDPLTGRRIQHRLEADARRALRLDRQQAAVTGTARTLAQCMADALQDIALNTSHCAHTPSSSGGVGSHHSPQSANNASGQNGGGGSHHSPQDANNASGQNGGGGSHHSPQDANNASGGGAQPAARPETVNGDAGRATSHNGHLANTATNAAPSSSPGSTTDSRLTNNTHDGSHDGHADSTTNHEHASNTPNAHNRASDAGRAYTNSKPNNDNRPASTTNREPANSCGGGLGSVSGCECENSAPSASAAGGRGVKSVGLGGRGPGKPSVRAQVAVVAHLDAAQSKLVGELAGGEPLPASVLEELLCNSEAFGVLFSDKGKPLWQGNKKRFADDNLMRALIARDGACVGCGAHYAICEGHHIEPVSLGGATDIDNMVLACARCHHRVHHDGWQVVVHADRYSIEPPQRVHHGPAHAPERAPLFRRAQPHEEAPDALFEDAITDRATHRRLLEEARAALRSSRNRQPDDISTT